MGYRKRRLSKGDLLEHCALTWSDGHLDKSDGKIDFDVYIVWQCYILGNAKWLISSTLPDGMYYELTWDSKNKQAYLDAYKKFENRSIPVD